MVIVKPGRATRSHLREVASCISPGEEEDCILLTRQTSRGSADVEVRAAQKSARIAERLARIAERLESQGRTDRLAKITESAEVQLARKLAREEEKAARAEERGASGGGGARASGGGRGGRGRD